MIIQAPFFFSLHPELDAFYFEFIHGALIHSLDGERLLRNMRQRTMSNNISKIGYENRWFRMARDDFDADLLMKIDSKQLATIKNELKQVALTSVDKLGFVAELQTRISTREKAGKSMPSLSSFPIRFSCKFKVHGCNQTYARQGKNLLDHENSCSYKPK